MTLVGLAARNVLRNKTRAVMTICGVAIAVLTFMLLRTVIVAWTVGADYAVKDRLVTRHKMTFVMSLPKRYMLDVQKAPHVRMATFANWFGGKDPKHDHEFFATIAVDSATYFQVFDDFGVPPDQLEAWQHDTQGALVGDALAKKLGWKIGDKVLLESGIYADKPNWEFKIDGIYEPRARSADRSSFIFHWDYLDKNIAQSRRDQIGWIVARVDDGNHTADIAAGIDKVFDEKEVPTLSQDEHTFQTSFLASFSAVLKAIDLVSIVILLIMALILGNTIAMGVRERTNEYGVLKALGFSNSHITFFIVSESVIIALLGAAVGVGIAYPFIDKGMGRWLEENMGSFFPWFRVAPEVAITAFALAFGLGLLAAIVPAVSASRLKVVEALRRVA
jgi:putative ABC transport system permease protein